MQDQQEGSDNWASLKTAAELVGLTHEPSQPGVTQTNGLAEK